MPNNNALQEAVDLEHEGDIQGCIGLAGFLGGGFGALVAINKIDSKVAEIAVATPSAAIAVGGLVMLCLGLSKIIRSADM